MTAAVTPLEALRRLYEVARKVDADESQVFDTLLQGELAVAESVLRVAAAAPVATDSKHVGWEYCPECGCLETDPPQEGVGYFCTNCGQEWHGDLDYSGVVRANLERLHKLSSSNITLAAPVVPVAAQPVVPDPVAWLVYAEDHNGMVPQFPAYQVKLQADRYAAMYGQTPTEVRPLYAAPHIEAQPAWEVVAALKVARAALHTAEYAIKGREHTGFITIAIAVIDKAMAQGDKQ